MSMYAAPAMAYPSPYSTGFAAPQSTALALANGNQATALAYASGSAGYPVQGGNEKIAMLLHLIKQLLAQKANAYGASVPYRQPQQHVPQAISQAHAYAGPVNYAPPQRAPRQHAPRPPIYLPSANLPESAFYPPPRPSAPAYGNARPYSQPQKPAPYGPAPQQFGPISQAISYGSNNVFLNFYVQNPVMNNALALSGVPFGSAPAAPQYNYGGY